MRNLKIKYIAASNFMCFGPEGIEIDFEKLGNIVHVFGEHLDLRDDEGRLSSNAVGKSACCSIISYALTGQTVKAKLTHDDVINNKYKKNLYCEIMFDDYRIVRKRKPDSLRIWKSVEGMWTDDTELTRGGMPKTQEFINQEVLGLTSEALGNLIFFTDDNRGCFLECGKKEKREIVENLLGLERYRAYADNAAVRKKQLKAKVKGLAGDYDRSLTELKVYEDRIKKIENEEVSWKKTKTMEAQGLFTRLKAAQTELSISDSGQQLAKYKEAQERIAQYSTSMIDYAEKREKLAGIVNEASEKAVITRGKRRELEERYAACQKAIRDLQNAIKTNEQLIINTESKKGTKCLSCYGVIDEKNFAHVVTKAKNEIDAGKANLERERVSLTEFKQECDKYDGFIKQIQDGLDQASGRLKEISQAEANCRKDILELSKIKEPSVGGNERVLESQIDDLKKQLLVKKAEIEGPSPFIQILTQAKSEFANKKIDTEDRKKAVDKAEEDIPYYDYFIKAFGETGIRRFVIRDILPTLNTRIAYWLQFLMDNRITLKFDDELQETIERNPVDGDPFVYWGLSKGQQRRMNLAVSLAFSHIMMVNTGMTPSFLFLDEVSTNIDQNGCYCIYNMLCELSKDRQVFVTTHSEYLQQLLDGVDKIHLVMKDGITTKVA